MAPECYVTRTIIKLTITLLHIIQEFSTLPLKIIKLSTKVTMLNKCEGKSITVIN